MTGDMEGLSTHSQASVVGQGVRVLTDFVIFPRYKLQARGAVESHVSSSFVADDSLCFYRNMKSSRRDF